MLLSQLNESLKPSSEKNEIIDKFRSYLNSSGNKVGSQLEIPEYYLCRITDDLMQDPVTLSSGFTYEK